MNEKGSHVRLTEEAHGLLAEMAEDCDTTMRELASEAVTRMANRTRDKRRYTIGTFIQGAIVGGVVMFFMGVLL